MAVKSKPAAKGSTKSASKSSSKPAGKGEYDDTNRFVLFPNDKDGNDARPDFTGKITLEDGTVKRLAAWTKQSDRVGEYLSGQISDIQES